MSEPHEDAALVLALQGGDQGAFAPLFAEWSDRCFDVARRIVRDDGQAAEVTQETFLVAWQQIDTLRNPEAFGGWVLRTARNRALNRLEKERRAVPVAGDAPVLVGIVGAETADQPVDDAMTATDHQAIVAAATAALGERDASVLDLHLRHGMGAPEIADELGVTTNNAHQLLHRMKKRLAAGIRAWTLVRGGRPSCDGLADALAAAEVTTFGRDAVAVIDDHVGGCDECSRRQAAMVAPGALFAAAPVVAMTATVRATVTEGLRASGVPVDGPPAGGEGAPTDGDDGSGDVAEDAIAAEDAMAAEDASRRRRVLATVIGVVVLFSGVAAGVMAFDRGEDLGPVETAAIAPTERPGTTTTTAAEATTTVEPLPAPVPTEPGTTTDDPAEAPPQTTSPPVADQPTPTSPPLVFDPPVSGGTSTTTAPRAPAPQIVSFAADTALAPGGACAGGQWATTLSWTTSDATSVAVTASGEPDRTGLGANGSVVACRATPSPPPGGWTLTASGPGGQAVATA